PNHREGEAHMTQDTRPKSDTSLTRRDLLRAGGALSLGVLGAGIAAACGPAAGPSSSAPAGGTATAAVKPPRPVTMRLGWLANSPKDFVGKRIGMHARARPLIDADIAKYQLPSDKIEISVIGSDTVPLKTGQVDIITGWVIDAPQMAAVGPGAKTLLLWDLGI